MTVRELIEKLEVIERENGGGTEVYAVDLSSGFTVELEGVRVDRAGDWHDGAIAGVREDAEVVVLICD